MASFANVIKQQDGIIKRIIAKLGELEYMMNTIAKYSEKDIEILGARILLIDGEAAFHARNSWATDDDWKAVIEQAMQDMFSEARARKIREQDHEKELRSIIADYEEARPTEEEGAVPTQAETLIYKQAKVELDKIEAAREVKELVVLREHLEKQSEEIRGHLERSESIPLQLSEAQRQTKGRITELQGR